jgi:hypothetical protein
MRTKNFNNATKQDEEEKHKIEVSLHRNVKI